LLGRTPQKRNNERNETYVCDPSQDKEAVEQIVRRCDNSARRSRSAAARWSCGRSR